MIPTVKVLEEFAQVRLSELHLMNTLLANSISRAMAKVSTYTCTLETYLRSSLVD